MTVCTDKKIFFYDLQTGRLDNCLEKNVKAVSPDTKTFFCSQKSDAQFYDAKTGHLLCKFSEDCFDSCVCSEFSPDGKTLIACFGRTFVLFDVENKMLLAKWPNKYRNPTRLDFLTDGSGFFLHCEGRNYVFHNLLKPFQLSFQKYALLLTKSIHLSSKTVSIVLEAIFTIKKRKSLIPHSRLLEIINICKSIPKKCKKRRLL